MNILRRLLFFLNTVRVRHLLAGKIRVIRRRVMAEAAAPKTGRVLRKDHKLLWRGYGRRINYDWLEVYTCVSGKEDHRFIPEDIYYTAIEPRLNNKLFSKAWTDKNSYGMFIGGRVRMPEVVLRCVNGVLYSPGMEPAGRPEDYSSLPVSQSGERFIIKPTLDSGGGKGVRVISFSGADLVTDPPLPGVKSLPQLFGLYGGNFVMQRYIKQHPYFARFNESSLNTLRILTYRRPGNEEVVVLHRLLRIGRPGSVVDNQSSGGIACGVDPEGRLMPFGIDKGGTRHYNAGDVTFSTTAAVPFIRDICSTAVEVASKHRYSRLLGLDFAVNDREEVILIEVNDSNNEINFFQMTSGPLFGDYTEEVALSCRNMPRSFVIDYMI